MDYQAFRSGAEAARRYLAVQAHDLYGEATAHPATDPDTDASRPGFLATVLHSDMPEDDQEQPHVQPPSAVLHSRPSSGHGRHRAARPTKIGWWPWLGA